MWGRRAVHVIILIRTLGMRPRVRRQHPRGCGRQRRLRPRARRGRVRPRGRRARCRRPRQDDRCPTRRRGAASGRRPLPYAAIASAGRKGLVGHGPRGGGGRGLHRPRGLREGVAGVVELHLEVSRVGLHADVLASEVAIGRRKRVDGRGLVLVRMPEPLVQHLVLCGEAARVVAHPLQLPLEPPQLARGLVAPRLLLGQLAGAEARVLGRGGGGALQLSLEPLDLGLELRAEDGQVGDLGLAVGDDAAGVFGQEGRQVVDLQRGGG